LILLCGAMQIPAPFDKKHPKKVQKKRSNMGLTATK